MDVKDVLAAEGVGFRVVLVGAEGPVGVAGYRVGGDLAQKTDLLSLDIDSVDEGLEIGRVTERVGFDLEGTLVGRVFIFVDGSAHLPEVTAQLALLFAL